MNRRLLVLGGGQHQKKFIRRAEERGIEVVVADYYPDAPGKQLATHPTDVDALDIEANIQLARRYNVSGVVTAGTDMAIVTMAQVAHEVGLPCYLTPASARTAVNKRLMKTAFARQQLPHARYVEVDHESNISALVGDLSFPVVVKPTDSQGQRATSRVDNPQNLRPAVESAIRESRTAPSALVEKFVFGCEFTASAWVVGGEVRLLMVTDRVTYNPQPAIGICFQHIFPSARAALLTDQVRQLLTRIAEAYQLSDGPLYVQMIVQPGGELCLMEAACRIGGGHEASLIPLVTGVDVVDRLIDLVMDGSSTPIDYEFDKRNPDCHALVNFLLPNPGRIAKAAGYEQLIAEGIVDEGEFYSGVGHYCEPVNNALGRIGYFIAKDKTRTKLLDRARAAYARLELIDETGRNLLFWPPDVKINS